MKGDLSIVRWYSNKPIDTGIRIEVTDASSRIRFLEVDLTPEQFGLALTGQSKVLVEYEVRGLEYIGMIVENKTEHIVIPYRWSKYDFDTDKEIHDSLRPFIEPLETDGWKASYYLGTKEQVIHDGDQTRIRIDFTRYVEPF